MKQSLFKPRILLLATAFAAGAASAAGTSADTYAPAMTTTKSQLDSSTSATSPAPMDSTAAAPGSGTLDSSTSATAPLSEVAAVTPRNASGRPLKPKSVDNKFRAELRNCVQMAGAERDGCLDRAIENRAQS